MTAAVRPGRPSRTRRTQTERSTATRARLLDATLALLVEVGYARTTTQAVAERAGLSRGAQLHHFPTKVELVVAAVRHLAELRSVEVRAAARHEGREAGLARLAAAFDGPLFLAALELWVAARTDDTVRAAVQPLEQELGMGLRGLAGELLGGEQPSGRDHADRDGTRRDETVDLTLDLLRGIGVAALLSDPTDAARRRDRLLAAWARRMDPAPTAPTPPATTPTEENP